MMRHEFPGLQQQVHGKPLVYLDNAATAQRPQAVLDAINNYYLKHNANIHRGVHSLSESATELYEQARNSLARLINAPSEKDLIFVRGCTEGVNLVAQTFVRSRVKAGDEILISHLEHHSNIVPWQILCEQTGAKLKVIPMNQQGELVLDDLDQLLNERTKFMSVVHVSNALGTINPVKKLIAAAHAKDIPVLIDGAQATPHIKVDVQDLDCDFYTVSGHKMYGPTGSGILYGKSEHLSAMPPYHGGGEMISKVTFESTVYNAVPAKFEAGTPNIAGGIGLGAAAEFMMTVGMDKIAERDQVLKVYAEQALSEVPGLRLVGTATNKSPVFSFVIDGIHAHDIGTIIDHHGVAIRTGHHCTMPIFQFYGLAGSCRASLAFYNTEQEVDVLVESLLKAKAMFQ
ncbi:SufS family cysteine desulfurase [Marinicella sp. S1101]|uniref:aminotransferase class V-fold PLP-dependent enzyme n=1 Tax=Marinicella marina TaxID=2996016 RepID=UPI002260CFF3|nr:SufS family cysteine desulfurase [Marinicella marina]MCX7554665.1 SufS family cysteine desulfurase [Marinicella marina]MDJ1140730.1 SufS family cysteine desulfurase [Marinicella marina]